MSAAFGMVPGSDLSLQLAKKYVTAYSDEVMAQHQLVMKCCDECETLLRSGIDAYLWLRNAERIMQKAAMEGIAVSEDLAQAIDVLYRTWLEPCELAEEKIRRQQNLGYPVANLQEFRSVCEEVKKRIHSIDVCDTIDEAFKGNVFDASFWAGAADSSSV